MKNLSSIVLWLSFAVTAVMAILFFAVGEWEQVPTTTGGVTETSPYTDALLYWGYAIVLVGVAALILFAIKTLIIMFQTDAKSAIGTLAAFAAFALLLVICYFASPAQEFSKIVNGETISYTATEMKVIDMWLFSIYALIGVTILLVVGFGIKNLITKK